AKNLDLLLNLDEIVGDRPRTAFFAAVDLVKTGGQGDKARHRENDRKPQSYVPTAHTVDSPHLCDIRVSPSPHTAFSPDRPLGKARSSSGPGGRVARRQRPWIPRLAHRGGRGSRSTLLKAEGVM